MLETMTRSMYTRTDPIDLNRPMPGKSYAKTLGALKFIFCVWILISTTACSHPNLTPYQAMVKEEVESGKRVDELFEGLHFNMTLDRFEAHSFKMNQEGLFFQHGGSREVILYMDNQFDERVDFVFYPTFEREIIVGLSGYFWHPNWNGFRKELFASVLQEKLVIKLQEWLGGRPFIELPGASVPLEKKYAKVDGNRHIVLRINPDNRKVEILFTDLRKDPKYGKFYGIVYPDKQ